LRKSWRVSRTKTQRRQQFAQAAQAAELAQAMAEMMQKSADSAQESIKSLDDFKEQERPAPFMTLALAGERPILELPATRLREDFRETAAWLPQLRTGPNGRLQAAFQLPDSITKYRLTAVGLTKQTEIGVGRSSLTANLPLVVQLILPRFAVEKDRLFAVGILHNNTQEAQSCKLLWNVSGADPEGFNRDGPNWRVQREKDRAQVRGTLTVGARQTLRFGVWLNVNRLDDAQVMLRAASDKFADAESRRLPVQPLGRPAEVALTGSFQGERELKLPDGFVARDLRITVGVADATQGLEGLPYLIQYPYGCVEQTMSRFLPAVTAKRALQRTAVALPAEVAAKLPDVLSKGLRRLENFQHPDGGWGWWEKDDTNDRMTAYVIYGLARCRASGTPIDEGSLKRGCQYLRRRLKSGLRPESLRASAWLSLALAGEAESRDLKEFAKGFVAQPRPENERPENEQSARNALLLALACQAAGLEKEADRLWKQAKGSRLATTESLAILLNAQVVFDASKVEIQAGVAELLTRRKGHRWENTRATSWAIEAMSASLAKVDASSRTPDLRVVINEEEALNARDQQRRRTYRVRKSGAQLPVQGGLSIRLQSDDKDFLTYAVTASGVRRLDQARPRGDEVRLLRRLTNLEGAVITGPLKVGQVVAVKLSLELQHSQQYLMVEDRRPSGCEFALEQLQGVGGKASHVEFRDDRVCAFFTKLPAGKHELTYYLRAETPGLSHVLPGVAYPMYQETLRGETAGSTLTVE
ncbi:MAG: hypothetical protein N2C14_11955, partial [Planctomycetales bacterium]